MALGMAEQTWLPAQRDRSRQAPTPRLGFGPSRAGSGQSQAQLGTFPAW